MVTGHFNKLYNAHRPIHLHLIVCINYYLITCIILELNYQLIMLINYPQSLTNADILGQGNLNLVREKSGKSQGILLSIICGNPDLIRQ